MTYEITIISSKECLEHDVGCGEHPETADRIKIILESLLSEESEFDVSSVSSRRAERQWILTVHDNNYLLFFEESALSGRSYLQHPDNMMCFESYEAALFSAGAGLVGVDLIENGEIEDSCGIKTVFCAVRPPGHHAEKSRASGFCFFNNAAIAANYWKIKYGRKRIFIVDWDAHHGNGIQAAFVDDPDVLYASVHEHPTFSFPGTGFADERGSDYAFGTIINIPLAPGSGDEEMISALQDKIEYELASFGADAMIVAAGFDGHEKDDMSSLAFSTDLYGKIGKIMAKWGKKYCNGRMLTILEGGYHIESLVESVKAYLAEFSRNGL